MKKLFIKVFDKVIVMLLGIAGIFTGCERDCAAGKAIPVYGTFPSTYYEIKGTVKNKANSKQIPNIQITSQIHENLTDTLYTNSKGNYVYKFYDYSEELGYPICLKFEDIDGNENGGNFASKEIDVKITKVNRSCNGYDEKYSKTENIKLEKK